MPSAMRNSVSFGGISRRQTYSRSKGARQRRGEMAIDSIKSVAVLGAGTMGNGIAQVFARAGYQVILRDVEQRFLDRALETIAKNLDREIKKGKLPERDKGAVLRSEERRVGKECRFRRSR